MISLNVSTDLIAPANKKDYKEGSLSAPVVLVEYGDYQCLYCAQAASIVQELQNEMGEQLCYVFRHFPLMQLHPQALQAAKAAEAAAVQRQFWEMHYMLFANQGSLSDAALLSYAEDLGLDLEQFKQDLNSEKTAQRIQTDIKTGMESGIEGTPAFYINGALYAGGWTLSDMRLALKAAMS